MPSPKIHEQIDYELFNRSYFKEVHSWIDGTFDGQNGRYHWKNRHFIQAILEHFNPKDYPDKQLREEFITVAKMHVIMDWMFYYHRVVIPFSRQDVIDQLRSEGIIIE